jgi:hypothetical protein
MSADAGQLVRGYIEQTVGQPAFRDFAPPVLEQLVTEQSTKRPRSERELVDATHLQRAQVRAVMNGLGMAALARPLDPAQSIWELSHDFIARAVARYLGRRRRHLLQRGAFYAAPMLLMTLMVSIALVVIVAKPLSPAGIIGRLGDYGLEIMNTPPGLVISNMHNESIYSTENMANLYTNYDLAEVSRFLAALPDRIFTLQLSLTGTQIDNIEPLAALPVRDEQLLLSKNVSQDEVTLFNHRRAEAGLPPARIVIVPGS